MRSKSGGLHKELKMYFILELFMKSTQNKK